MVHRVILLTIKKWRSAYHGHLRNEEICLTDPRSQSPYGAALNPSCWNWQLPFCLTPHSEPNPCSWQGMSWHLAKLMGPCHMLTWSALVDRETEAQLGGLELTSMPRSPEHDRVVSSSLLFVQVPHSTLWLTWPPLAATRLSGSLPLHTDGRMSQPCLCSLLTHPRPVFTPASKPT